MKPSRIFKNLLFILLVLLSAILTILEELYNGTFSLMTKLRLNYQLMMYIKQLTR